MKLFRCDHCGHLLYFENTRCERCGRTLGYEPEVNALCSLEGGPEVWTAPFLDNREFVFCANAAHGACNWLVPYAPGADPYCTLLGHFRHEIGHHYWDILIGSNPDNLAEYRRLFGDETQSYEAALQAY